MTSREERALGKLDQVELELRKAGYWDPLLDQDAIRREAESITREWGESPVMHMPLERWLQAVFLPNARKAATEGSLPDSSQVGLMAMRAYDYHSVVPEAAGLLKALREFDAIIGETD